MAFFSPSLDDMISKDDPIRLFDELLSQLSWSEWEEKYSFNGQPPIHPRLVAGCMLWALIKGIRSTRKLEETTRYRTDFIWFLNGRTIDHTTFAKFRHQFKKPLAELSKELKRKAIGVDQKR